MDRVRFGRALGMGARQATKALMKAADAAAAPNPSPARRPARSSAAPPTSPPPASRPAARPSPPRPRSAVPNARTVQHHAKELRRSIWTPFARFSSVLWLEVTGTFFAVFALIAGQQIWKFRAALRTPSTPEAQRLYLYAVVFAVFAYFAVSSFLRAKRRGRR